MTVFTQHALTAQSPSVKDTHFVCAVNPLKAPRKELWTEVSTVRDGLSILKTEKGCYNGRVFSCTCKPHLFYP